MGETGLVRIGELSRRAGVSPELLRAWERRYGLLRPTRSPGGLRLYSAGDLDRVRLMQRYVAEGFAAAEAAALALRPTEERIEAPALAPIGARRELTAALDAFDEPRAQAILDQLFGTTTVDTVLSDIVLPYLRELGDRWQQGDATIAQEHFASSVLRGRMLGLARGWGRGFGPVALLACVPGEQHELGLIAFGLALRSRGWRIAYLGGDTPLDTIDQTARSLSPGLVALSAVTEDRVRSIAPELRALAGHSRLGLGGEGARTADPEALGALALTGTPVSEAEKVTALMAGSPTV